MAIMKPPTTVFARSPKRRRGKSFAKPEPIAAVVVSSQPRRPASKP